MGHRPKRFRTGAVPTLLPADHPVCSAQRAGEPRRNDDRNANRVDDDDRGTLFGPALVRAQATTVGGLDVDALEPCVRVLEYRLRACAHWSRSRSVLAKYSLPIPAY